MTQAPDQARFDPRYPIANLSPLQIFPASLKNMAAESVGLAASVAGLVSLGLQITGGIASYLDALESRRDELTSVRRQNDALAAALDTIKTATSHNSFQGQQHVSATERNTQCCKAELQAIEELLAELADCDTTTWRQDISASHSESLAAIEAGSRNHASELLLLRSEVTTALTPVYEIRDQVPHFERKLDNTADLILSHSAATSAQIRESDRAAQEDVRRSHDLLQATMERQMKKLQAIERLQRETLLVSRAASFASILHAAVDFSFTMTTGAGGFSISPNLTLYATVDGELDPAFRILGLLCGCTRSCKGSIDSFAIACFKNLIKLFDDKKACPAAVTRGNQSLLHSVAQALGYEVLLNSGGPRDLSVFSQLVKMLRGFGVPEFTFNSLNTDFLLASSEYDTARTKDAINILLQENLENQPPVLEPSPSIVIYNSNISWHTTFGILDLYEICPGYAEACGCGLLSMAVTSNDTEEVVHILSRHSDSVSEVDIHGNTVLHLAAAKPRILSILLENADLSLLDKANKYGATVLRVAMHYSGRLCINGASSRRCRRCGCTRCVDILLKAGCNIRTGSRRDHNFTELLRSASELARRRYVVHIKASRISRMRLLSTSFSLLKPIQLISGCIDMKQDYPQLRRSQSCHPANVRVEGDDDWIYREIYDTSLADLFYRYGFRPSPSFFCHPWSYSQCGISCFRWLVVHGVDLFIRLPIQPPGVRSDSEIGLYVAHFVGYAFGRNCSGSTSSDLFDVFGATVTREELNDGCECHCSIGRCDPFIWMLKGMMQKWFEGQRNLRSMCSEMKNFYTRCSIKLTSLTYKAAIRYATFEALELTHTCCDPYSVMQTFDVRFAQRNMDPWLKSDDIVIINQEQTSLLELHGKLVGELTEAASSVIKTDSEGRPLFPDFWRQCWMPRMEEELDKLSGSSLTEAEIKGAEEIGVRWCEQAEAPAKKNPYDESSLEHWFYNLDLICPEYKEPWPEELRQVEELS
ncbi:uncharacterized protein PG986_004668 [Apiospora aurea]|uniref:Fungal N-terminal domain-containing protein n=1 Tax=Apiospora aurea TaxID=335848 RepID=A0ABR1QPU6_9PEZI